MRAAPASNFVIFAPNLLVAIASRLPLVLFRLRLPKANQALVARSGISNELGMEQPEVPDEPRAGSASSNANDRYCENVSPLLVYCCPFVVTSITDTTFSETFAGTGGA